MMPFNTQEASLQFQDASFQAVIVDNKGRILYKNDFACKNGRFRLRASLLRAVISSKTAYFAECLEKNKEGIFESISDELASYILVLPLNDTNNLILFTNTSYSLETYLNDPLKTEEEYLQRIKTVLEIFQKYCLEPSLDKNARNLLLNNEGRIQRLARRLKLYTDITMRREEARENTSFEAHAMFHSIVEEFTKKTMNTGFEVEIENMIPFFSLFANRTTVLSVFLDTLSLALRMAEDGKVSISGKIIEHELHILFRFRNTQTTEMPRFMKPDVDFIRMACDSQRMSFSNFSRENAATAFFHFSIHESTVHSNTTRSPHVSARDSEEIRREVLFEVFYLMDYLDYLKKA